MLLVLKILCWSSLLLLLHTYVFYPFILYFLAKINRPGSRNIYSQDDPDLPIVTAIISVYNEEKVIREKLHSLLKQHYPAEKLNILIGSDNSSDRSARIIREVAGQNSAIHFIDFKERRGKPDVVNDLARFAEESHGKNADHAFLLTDANVMLGENTLYHLVKNFKDKSIVLVDSNMINTGISNKGISRSENIYVTNEVMLKWREGHLWGKMVGPFGGCYALRSNWFSPVPEKFLVDDFYIAMKALIRGGKAINDLEAICYEQVPHEMEEEYRRKARISAGNLQNLKTFSSLLLKPFTTLGFAFISHKVLRWFGPLFILITLLASAILSLLENQIYIWLFGLMVFVLFVVPLLDKILKGLGIHILLLRNITYFNAMNVALLQGMLKYIYGIKDNIWQPTRRD